MRTFVVTIVAVVSVMSAGFPIYYGFRLMESKVNEMQNKERIEIENLKNEIQNVNSRIDRRVDPLEIDIEKLKSK